MAEDDVTDTGLSTLSNPDEGETVIEYCRPPTIRENETLSRGSIVFVHGLQGHPRESWSCRSSSPEPPIAAPRTDSPPPSKKRRLEWNQWGFFQKENLNKSNTVGENGSRAQSMVYWPKDFLASDFPNARIMTWGYNTNITRSYRAANQGNIFAHARNLLYDLDLKRRRSPDRDLVFIAHSLGGIIVKEVLRRSEVDPDPKIKKLFGATTGVIFFGTPHRGSPDWASFGEGISIVASTIMGVEANSEIVHALLPTGVELELCRESFAAQWVSRHGCFTVRTYQEGRGLTGFKWGGFNKKVFGFIARNYKYYPFPRALNIRVHC